VQEDYVILSFNIEQKQDQMLKMSQRFSCSALLLKSHQSVHVGTSLSSGQTGHTLNCIDFVLTFLLYSCKHYCITP